MGTPIGDLITTEKIDITQLAGKTIAIDAHNILYQFLTSIRGPDGKPLMNAEGDVTSHIAGLLYRTSNLIEAGIKPVFVFDGPPSALKRATLDKRKAIRTAAKEEMEKAIDAGDLEKARSMGARAVSLNKEMIDEAHLALESMGLPIVQAKQEGEAQAGELVKEKKAYAVATQDYDALLCGAPVVIRNMGITGKRKLPYRNAYVNVEPERFETEKVLHELKLTQKQMIWIGMLVGTDFNEKIPMIGPKKALKAVEGKKSFEDVLSGLKKTVDYDPYEIEEMFLHPSVFKDVQFTQTKMDREKVIAFYCDKHGFDHVRVSNALNKIEKKPEDDKQTALSKWG